MAPNRTLAIVTNRALDDDASGSVTYLRALMRDAREQAGFKIELYVASQAAFSNFPIRKIQPKSLPDGDVVWPGAMHVNGTYIALSPMVWMRFARRLAQEALRRLSIGPAHWRRVPSNLGEVPSASDLAAIVSEISRRRPDAVLVEYSSTAPLFDDLRDYKGARSVLMHDSFAARAHNFRVRGDTPDHVDISYDEEFRRLQNSDLNIYAASTDIPRFEAALPDAAHVWFRPVVSCFEVDDASRTPCLFFLGTDHAGNRDAIRHFIRDVWPQVRKAAPGAALKIAGDVGKTLGPDADAPGVEILGRVADLGDFASPDVIGLAPTRLASGVSIKIAEYLGLGMPCVSYPMGLDGFGAKLDSGVVRADTPADYAQACIDLLADADKRRAMSASGQALARDLLSDSGIVDELKRLRRAD